MKNWTRHLALPVLLLAASVVACSDVGTEPQLEPQAGIHAIVSVVNRNGFVIAKESDLTVGTVSATIDARGGLLRLGTRYSLVVPPNAVSAATVFTMSKPDGDHARLSFTATRGLVPNDIGRAGFARPLVFVVNYSGLRDLPADIDRTKVYWLQLSGAVQEQPTWYDHNNRVLYGALRHFSDYFVGFPID